MSGQEWGIVSAMLTVMSAEGVAIKVLWGKLTSCTEARVNSLEDQLKRVRQASSELDPPKTGGAP